MNISQYKRNVFGFTLVDLLSITWTKIELKKSTVEISKILK